MNATLRTLALGLCLSLFCHVAMAQSPTAPAGMKKTTKVSEATNTVATPASTNSGVSEEQRLLENDADAVARKFFNVTEAPADFPVYDDATMNKDSYREHIRAYAKAHPDLVREKYKARLAKFD